MPHRLGKSLVPAQHRRFETVPPLARQAAAAALGVGVGVGAGALVTVAAGEWLSLDPQAASHNRPDRAITSASDFRSSMQPP
jgi:hypothetical protein